MSILGVIFSNLHDKELKKLTVKRTMGAVPFGGKYRLVDFPLSAMVGAGITDVRVIAHHNYQSLMEHIGSGKDWDLARRTGGIQIVPPYSTAYQNKEENYDSRMETLFSIRGLLSRTSAEEILFCDCDIVGTPDFGAMIEAHRSSGLPMTVAESYCEAPLHVFLVKTEFLKRVLEDAEARGATSFSRDVVGVQKKLGNVLTYRFDNRFFLIHSLTEYYALHMALLARDGVRQELLENKAFPLYTKSYSNAPVKYGQDACVKNSLVAHGCVIEGEVVNSVLFRGVHVGRGCVVENAVLLDGCVLCGGAKFSSGIADKNARLEGDVTLHGHSTLPLFVEEGRVVR